MSRMWRYIFLMGTLILLSGKSARAEPVTGHEVIDGDKTKLVVIWNDLYRLTFDPARGGRCSSFIHRETGREWIYEGKTAGLFLDHFAHQPYPGELLETAYDYEVIDGDGDSIAIRLWTTAKGGADGRDALTRGLQVEKTITLHGGRRDVQVTNAFTNPTTEGKNVGLWVQQCFGYGGDRLYDLYYRPSSHGIHRTGMDDTGKKPFIPVTDPYSADFVGAGKYTPAGGREPVAGWTAGRDRRNDEGAIFLIDYNYLDVLYNSAGSVTTEWFMDKVPLPPGKRWSVDYVIIPVNGFKGFAHASTRVIADTQLTSAPDRVDITHQLAAATAPHERITIATTIHGVRSKQDMALPALVVDNVGLQPLTVRQAWPRPQTEPLVARITLSGDGWEERYEVVHEGAFGGEGIHGAGEMAEYEIPRARKVKQMLKPDSWERPLNAHPRILLLYGLFTHHYRIEDAVRKLDPEAEITISEQWDTFPATYDELLSYDLIIVSNLPAGPDYASIMLSDVVRYGGVSALSFGGMNTFGAGQWRETELMGILPAEIPTAFDLQRVLSSTPPRVAAPHPAVDGIAFPGDTRFYWVNVMVPRDESSVVLACGDQPLVIVAPSGKGRVAAIAATCNGAPLTGEREAWTTPEWISLLTQTMKWLMAKE